MQRALVGVFFAFSFLISGAVIPGVYASDARPAVGNPHPQSGYGNRVETPSLGNGSRPQSGITGPAVGAPRPQPGPTRVESPSTGSGSRPQSGITGPAVGSSRRP